MTIFTGIKTALAVLTVTASSWAAADDEKMQHVLAGEHRAENSARDESRHPGETLSFFGLEPDMTVVEIAPGGGWYTEILAPYLRDTGTYYAAHFDPNSSVAYYQRSRAGFDTKLAANPELYDQTQVTQFELPNKLDIAPAGSADMVLTFRNVHNWYMRGGGEEKVALAFDAFYKALKPGGVLGVVDHRLPEDYADEAQDHSGYIKTSTVVKVAEAAGLVLDAQSEVNANPKDTAQHEKGVWTLPPSYRLGDTDRAKYEAIGESDRMTLRFVKPE
ncbi:methyltransferase [Gilvimarinus agarilyticus]|uniref:class I SAM-dependent methyltransferase n=1 Tax=unclassified Gilvimarinus TaxID=2642066 RepID=UPI001C08D1C5|nr:MULTISPECIES: methyltransferase [unclassified Gilvimarinus]MBU2884465.1 methyltransferase [Gilvimarinus agarilyticus]MDO6569601.1 methyltransferase [Gilvimarinus sp. 2_MG-2023]MDO6748559.1 methyltransferase [Gilvimarinus sp. 1_MG-2023]